MQILKDIQQFNLKPIRNYFEVDENSILFLIYHDLNAIDQAKNQGCKYFVVEENIIDTTIHIYCVDNIRKTWAEVAALLYPNKPTNILAVTGTNGKTSVSYLYMQAIGKIKNKCGYIGTLGSLLYQDNTIVHLENSLTSPDAMDLHRMLQNFKQLGCDDVIIEASSHGLDQSRLDYIDFKVTAFTNLTIDHLDYHSNMEEYFKAKYRLFSELSNGWIVVNVDDQYGQIIYKNFTNRSFTYGAKENVDLQFINYSSCRNFIFKYQNTTYTVQMHFLGHYNCYNLMCVIGMLINMNINFQDIIAIIDQLILPPGRMQEIPWGNKKIYVDYAHTPDGLSKILEEITRYKCASSKIWTVFGCGGNRDRSKRSLMGQIAHKFSDVVIVTDDNPRTEDPQQIRKDIINNLNNIIEISDREEAIAFLIQNMSANDIGIVAGKGHENYQIINQQTIYFSDYEMIQKYINKLSSL